MQISMYQASVPRFIHMLGNLSAILDKAKAHVAAKGIKEEALTNFRLYPDMLPFAKQIMLATDTAKACPARLAGVAPPVFEDVEQTFDELQARLAKTIAYLKTFGPEQIDGGEDREVTLKRRDGEVVLPAMQYLFWHALPNFHFHVTTAYAILRHNGVEIGKSDYLGKVG